MINKLKNLKILKSKKNYIVVLLAVILVVIIGVFGFSNRLDADKTVKIEQGLSTMDIAEVLKENKVISSKLLFYLKVNLSQYRGQLKYGDFKFTPRDNYDEVIKILATKGAVKETVTVTIPEGYSVELIAKKIEEAGLVKREEFIKAINDDYQFDFLRNTNIPKDSIYRLEGFLFPSTYEFYKDVTAHEIINTMLLEFEKQYKKITPTYDGIFDIVTKASLIEREAKTDKDRTLIAGVIENRLKEDMLLQIDACVIYAMSNGKYDVERVLYEHLKIDSPYNTYKNKGLPKGPIASPGEESLRAAITPANHDYLYYRTDTNKNDGSHVFSKTFEEHKTVNN